MPRFWFFGWGAFQKSLRASRVVLLLGDFGTGKTLFSVALGYYLLLHQYVERAAFNFPCSFGSPPIKRRTYFVVDEGGRLFDNRTAYTNKELNQISADMTWDLRKEGSYVLMPSYLDTDKRFRKGLRVWRSFPPGDLLRPNFFERNFWVYVWERGEEEVELRQPGVNYWSGKLVLVRPGAFFGSYDTYFKPSMPLLRDFVKRIAA